MEEFITQIQMEVKNDPLTTLNLVMSVVTVISFTRLVMDIGSFMFCKRDDSAKVDELLIKIDELINHSAFKEILDEIELLHNTVDRMDNYLTQVHYSVCVHSKSDTPNNSQSSSIKSEQESESELEPEPQPKQVVVEEEETIQPVAHVSEDKHSKLLQALKDGDTVSMTYKKQTFTATFVLKEQSQHGYILRSENNTEYNTPSHFSHSKKQAINSKIRSDNGWETVYVLQDKQKVSLNDLISQV